MDRRTFIRVAARALVAVSPTVLAQGVAQLRRIGVLTPDAGSNTRWLAAMLRDLGWIEDLNLRIETRAADGRNDRFPALVADLMQQNVEVIISFGTAASIAAKNATTSIPIVTTSGDPVRLGLVANASRPGANVTGWRTMELELAAKRLELLHELLPSATRIAELSNLADDYRRLTRRDYEQYFRDLQMQPLFVERSEFKDVDWSFVTITSWHAEALIVHTSYRGLLENRVRVMELALKHHLPTIADHRAFVVAGGLMSYAVNGAAIFESTAGLVDKILKGAKPRDLPIEQPTKFELVINLKTAMALDLTIPQLLLLRANEVIR